MRVCAERRCRVSGVTGKWRTVGRATALLFAAFVVLTAIWAGLGFLVTGPLAGGRVGTVDQEVARWLVARRSPDLDLGSQIGSMLAETMVKVVATAVIALIMFALWRSLREPFLVCGSLILEASVFITVTWIVARPRPDVPGLDEVSVSTSFPSGHAAAAAAYGAIAVVIFERTRNRWIRAVTILLAVTVPIVVGGSRMYRGVHYLTDVVAGIALGVVCVTVVYLIVRNCWGPLQPPDERLERRADSDRAAR